MKLLIAFSCGYNKSGPLITIRYLLNELFTLQYLEMQAFILKVFLHLPYKVTSSRALLAEYQLGKVI